MGCVANRPAFWIETVRHDSIGECAYLFDRDRHRRFIVGCGCPYCANDWETTVLASLLSQDGQYTVDQFLWEDYV